MNAGRIRPAVIAAIDGSQAAIRAAEWAADEASDRGVPLLMLAIVDATHPSPEHYHHDIEHAETSLHAARVAVEARGRPVKVEAEILRGHPAAILIAESDDAEMVCLGSAGIGRYSRALLGSTASEVAEKAHSPVAVIRSRPDQPRQDVNWIVVAVDDAPDSAIVVDQAMREAQLRMVPVLAIGVTQRVAAEPDELENRLQPWRRWYPDVHIYPVVTRADVAQFVKGNADLVPLAVIGSRQADQLAEIIGPHDHPVFRRAEASVLIVRT